MTVKEFEITQEDHDALVEKIVAARQTSGMFLSGGIPMSNPQEAANDGWIALGKKYGFRGMTARPSSRGPLIVLAEPAAPDVE